MLKLRARSTILSTASFVTRPRPAASSASAASRAAQPRPSAKRPTKAHAASTAGSLTDYELVELHATRLGALDLQLYDTATRTLRQRVDECDDA
jgi:hypothetical protein